MYTYIISFFMLNSFMYYTGFKSFNKVTASHFESFKQKEIFLIVTFIINTF